MMSGFTGTSGILFHAEELKVFTYCCSTLKTVWKRRYSSLPDTRHDRLFIGGQLILLDLFHSA